MLSFQVTRSELEFEKLASKEISEQLKAKHKTEIKSFDLQLQAVVKRNDEMEVQLKSMHLKEESYKSKLQDLEMLVAKLEKGVSQLESTSERGTVLQEQIVRLEKQLSEVHCKRMKLLIFFFYVTVS